MTSALLQSKARLQKIFLSTWAKPVLMLLCAVPAVLLLLNALTADLGPNPAEALIRQSGDLSIRALCYVLLLTPLRLLSGMPALGRFRRILGVSVFFYALLHMLCYAWLDMGLEWADIYRDLLKRPFIFVGFTALVFLSPLVLTSSNAAIRWMGLKKWRLLHCLVYVIAPLAVLHFYWMRASKQRFAEVALYGAILGLLLIFRALHWSMLKKQSKPTATNH